MAKYLLLIYTDEATLPATPEATMAMFAEYGAFTEAIAAQGILRAGEALEPTSASTTVRVRDGKTLVTDGPFAETKEALGGFFMIECDDLDTALGAAAGIPGARFGTIEVRPIIPMPEPGAAS
jgi:hypothetical protein